MLAHQPTSRICETQQTVVQKELHCPICCDILQSPLELVVCRAVVCAKCCCSWLTHCKNTSCPCCFGDHLQEDFSTVRPASQLLPSLLESLCVVCGECGGHVRLKVYSQHVNGGCQSLLTHIHMTLALNWLITAPLTSVELKIHSKLAKRSLAASPED